MFGLIELTYTGLLPIRALLRKRVTFINVKTLVIIHNWLTPLASLCSANDTRVLSSRRITNDVSIGESPWLLFKSVHIQIFHLFTLHININVK